MGAIAASLVARGRTIHCMATITSSDLAPAAKVHYALAGAEFDLDGDSTYETDDLDVVRNAYAHPWLKVEVSDPGAEPVQPVEFDFPHTAIDAALPQKEEHYAGEDAQIPTAETVAADDAQGDEPIVVNEPADPDTEDAK